MVDLAVHRGLAAKELDEPVDAEPARRGAGGVDCGCAAPVADWQGVVWSDNLFAVTAPLDSSLPFAVFLKPLRHAGLADLTRADARRQGELLTLVERIAVELLSVPRVQALRWADGGEHLHWWLMARPTGALQLRGTFLALWDDLLPLRGPDAVRADALLVAQRLAEVAGGTVH